MQILAPRRVLAGATALPLLVAAALAGSSEHAAAGRSVVLKNIAFSPAKLTVARGARVTFRFQDGGTNHNVTSRGAKRFKNSPTKGSGTYAVRFTKAGVYRYECTLHPGMKGSITVK